MTLDSRKC